MPNTLASSARFIAFADAAPILLTDVEDLHDSDLDGLLRDRLPQDRRRALRPAPRSVDAAAVAAAAGLAQMVVQPGRAALLAHDLGMRSAYLGGR
jgi:hypothetical protein